MRCSSLGIRKSKAARDSRMRAKNAHTPTRNTASQSGPFIHPPAPNAMAINRRKQASRRKNQELTLLRPLTLHMKKALIG